MEEPIKEIKKYNITEGENELKVYIHVVQAGPVLTTVPENYHATLAFTEQQAIADIRSHYPQGQPHTIGKKSEIKIKQILDHLNSPPAVAMIEPAKEAVLPVAVVTEEQKFQNFVNSTMLLADEYVKDTKKRNTLKKIISELTFHGKPNEGKTEDKDNQAPTGQVG